MVLLSVDKITFDISSNIFYLVLFPKGSAFKRFLCHAAGSGDPGGVQSSGPVFVAAVPALLALHRVLCLQALEEEEKEEEEERQSARFLCFVVVVPTLSGTVQDHSAK